LGFALTDVYKIDCWALLLLIFFWKFPFPFAVSELSDDPYAASLIPTSTILSTILFRSDLCKMSEARNPLKDGYYGYPEAKEGPETAYTYTPASNPVLRGLPLSIASSACVDCSLT